MPDSNAEPLVIWGGGAIGGTLAAYLARAGEPVLLIDRVVEHVQACRTTGLVISGPVEAFRQVVPAMTVAELAATERQFGRIVLAVKAQATREAIMDLAKHLAPDGFVLSAQNGLNEIEIAAQLGSMRTMGCFVNFGADWLAPGEILYGNRGAFVVGEIDGVIRERTRAMHQLIARMEPDALLTDRIWDYLWGKLAYGAMLFATALTMDSMAENFHDPRRTIVFDRLGREVMAVAEARGAQPIGFREFDIDAFGRAGTSARRHAAIAALGEYTSKTAKTHTGIYRDLAVRKRRTEVDAQIGVIVSLGREQGVATPVLAELVTLIHAIEEGALPMDFSTFERLIETCRKTSSAVSL